MNDKEDLGKEHAAAVWSRASTTYSHVGPRFFQHFGERLVSLAPIQAGDKVLDVAAGRGAVLFPTAEKVGQQGEVIGIDLAEGMVNETNREIQASGVKNARMLCMDATHLEFEDGSFDGVLCGFAIFFFPQLDSALTEFRRVLKPGGWLAVSTWGPGDQRWSWLKEIFADPMRKALNTGLQFDQPDAMRNIVEGAGFRDAQVIEEQTEMLYADEDEWWATTWSHGGRFALEGLTPEKLAWARALTNEKLGAMRVEGGIPSMLRALFTLARA